MFNRLERNYEYFESFYEKFLEEVKLIDHNPHILGYSEYLKRRISSNYTNLISIISEYMKMYKDDNNEYFSLINSLNVTKNEELDKLFTHFDLKWRELNNVLIKSGVKKEIYSLCQKEDISICPSCGLEINRDDEDKLEVSIEHILPKGIDEYKKYILFIDNIVPMCQDCNNAKGNSIVINEVYNPFFIEKNYSIDQCIEITISDRDSESNIIKYKIKDDCDNFLKVNFDLHKINIKYIQNIFKDCFVKRMIAALRYAEEKSEDDVKRHILVELEEIRDDTNDSMRDFDVLKRMTSDVLSRNIDKFYNYLLNQ